MLERIEIDAMADAFGVHSKKGTDLFSFLLFSSIARVAVVSVALTTAI